MTKLYDIDSESKNWKHLSRRSISSNPAMKFFPVGRSVCRRTRCSPPCKWDMNASTLMIGPERWDASLMYEGVFDDPVQHHNMTHNQKKEEVAKELQKIDLFHMEQFSYVLSRMKELKEADGTSLFDNSLITFGAGLGDGATHQFFDLPMILAGRGASQARPLHQVQERNTEFQPWLTANLMGLEIDDFADSSGLLSDLWT